MRKLLSILLFSPLFLYAQTDTVKGIQFEQGLSWEQVKAKAKAENKYIFIDCYATWCVPCKVMDKKVYVNDTVAHAVNPKFISVKVQMDSTGKDDENVKKWYTDARMIQQKFNVNSLPTFLFFSPEGNMVHFGVGFKDVNDFKSLIGDVISPSRQYYSQLENYKNGQKEYATMASLARNVKEIDKELAKTIAKDYKLNYLNKLSDSLLFNSNNIRFIAQDFPFLCYEEGSSGRFFNFFIRNPDKGDLLMSQGYSKLYVKAIIKKEEITSKLFKDGKLINKPNWKILSDSIGLKYGSEYAHAVIEDFKPSYYLFVKDWRNWAKLFEEKIKKTQPTSEGKSLGSWGDATALNENAWTVFVYCSDKSILRKAFSWSKLSIKLEKNKLNVVPFYDTKANLLYKLGKTQKAIQQEEKAIALDNENARKENKAQGDSYNNYSKVILKMKAGIPTWKVDEKK